MDNHLLYYTSQSAMSVPGKYAELYDDLPRDISSLTHVIQGLMMHDATLPLHGLTLTDEREREFNLRTIPERLTKLLAMNSAPLTTPRPPTERVTGTCRDFALLFASMVRHQGIPARIRTGFAPYLPGVLIGDRYLIGDHYIPEYWDVTQERWILIDPQIDDITRQANNRITFDTLDKVYD
ncbi:transglutaminase-like domain-containing protein [Chloroflexi bacterium TSY]|nr:transglutaminase-like domain-containing protein [Chloroflexi bacterium TSY]